MSVLSDSKIAWYSLHIQTVIKFHCIEEEVVVAILRCNKRRRAFEDALQHQRDAVQLLRRLWSWRPSSWESPVPKTQGIAFYSTTVPVPCHCCLLQLQGIRSHWNFFWRLDLARSSIANDRCRSKGCSSGAMVHRATQSWGWGKFWEGMI